MIQMCVSGGALALCVYKTLGPSLTNKLINHSLLSLHLDPFPSGQLSL